MKELLGGFGFLAGITYPFRAVFLVIKTPSLWGYLLIPILINLVLGIILYVSLLLLGWELVQDLLIAFSQWADNLVSNLPPWLGFLDFMEVVLGFFLHFLLILGLLLITGFLLMQFGVLLGAPWYGQLSEQLEKLRTGKVNIVEVGILRDIWRALLFELKKLTLIALFALPLLLLNFLPGIGTLISTTGGFILTGIITCLDFFDAPLERRRFPFHQKLGLVFGSFPASAGFSLVCLFLISIPLLNLLTIPLCVASGTLFFCDRILPKL